MIKFLQITILFVLPTWAFASVQLNIQCKLLETSGGVKNIHQFELISLSDDGTQSASLKTELIMDSNAIYTLNLSKGSLYMDATGDEIGADYYLSLNRLHNLTKTAQESKIIGKTQDMATLTVKDGFLTQASYRNNRGKLVNKIPSRLNLKYKMSYKSIYLSCKIL